MTNKKWKRSWLKVAEKFGDNIQGIGTENGLCYAFAVVITDNDPRSPLWKKAYEYMETFNPDFVGMAWFPQRLEGFGLWMQEYSEIRCLFACMFAVMTYDEFKEMCDEQ